MRVHDDREAEVGREAVGDGGPRAALVVGAVDAAVVLQEQPLGSRGVPGDLVHALAELGVLLALGQELRADPLVARRPGAAAVLGLVDAAGREGDGDRVRVVGVRQDRVEGLAAEAGGPLRAVRVVPQRSLQREGLRRGRSDLQTAPGSEPA